MSELQSQEEFTDTVFTRDRRAWWANFDVPGVNVTTAERLTVPDAYRQYLPWEITKVGLGYQTVTDVGGFTVEQFNETPFKGLQRDDTGQVLGVVTDAYTIVSNAEQAEILGGAVDGVKHAVASVGALAGGRTTFVSVDFDDVPSVNTAGQTIHPYLALVNNNDGGGSLKVYATGIRPECYNTIDLGWFTGTSFAALRHTASISDRIRQVQADLRVYLDLPAKAERVIEALTRQVHSATAYRAALELLTPVPDPVLKDGKVKNQRAVTIAENRRETILDLAFTDDRVGFQGTAWGAYQAFSTYDQWERRFRRTAATGVTVRQQVTLDKTFSGDLAKADGGRLATILNAFDVRDVKVGRKGLVLV